MQFSGRFMGNSPEVVRTGQMGNRVTVNYQAISETAISGVDFMPLAGTLTFGPNVRSQLIPLVIVRDIIAEGSETFTIRLSDPQPVGGLQLGPAAAKTFTIVDDEFGGTNLRFDAPAYSGDEGQTVTLTVRRDGGLGTMLAVSWKALGGNARAGVDFSPAEGTVTFDPRPARRASRSRWPATPWRRERSSRSSPSACPPAPPRWARRPRPP